MPTPDTYETKDVHSHWQSLRERIDPSARAGLQQAFEIAERVHRGQVRKTKDSAPVPYITHPLRVATLLLEEWERGEIETLATALLHDVIEDYQPPESRERLTQEIRTAFGKEVERAVWTLTKPEPGPMEVKSARDARYFSELRKSPEWVRLVKCADRVDNLRDAKAWGDLNFWARYSSESIGWHLFLAHETAPIAEVALFQALVDGERTLRGRVPIWVDGHIVDRAAAELLPEHVARHYGAVGLAIQGDALYVGLLNPADLPTIQALSLMTRMRVLPITISPEALQDALAAGLYGPVTED